MNNREKIENIWRNHFGHAKNDKLTASDAEWEFLQKLLDCPNPTLEHTRSLEQLNHTFINAINRKRKSLPIHLDEYPKYQEAIRASLPPFDFASHGFASNDNSGEVINNEGN